MKLHSKGLSVLLWSAFLLSMVLLTGCQSNETKAVPPTPPAEEKPASNYIQKVAVDPRGNEKWTELAGYAADLDADSQEEQIGLFTSAQRDAKGRIMWDDGQKWLLLVEDGADFYPLFQGYVQLGSVYYTVAGYDNIPTPKVTALVSAGAGMIFTNYAYDPDKKGYRIEPIYDSQGINLLFSSLPSYE